MAIISRRQYDHPALATAGGSALHASISNLYTVLGDDSMSRYKAFTAVANSSVGVIAHEFGLDFANLKVQIFTGTYPALTLVSDPIGTGWTVAATSGLASRSIDVTAPASGGPHTYAVLVSHESNATAFIPGLVSIGAQSFAGPKTFTGTLFGSDTTDSSSSTTGAFKTAGGLGVAKALFVGTTLNTTGAATLGGTGLTASHVIKSGAATNTPTLDIISLVTGANPSIRFNPNAVADWGEFLNGGTAGYRFKNSSNTVIGELTHAGAWTLGATASTSVSTAHSIIGTLNAAATGTADANRRLYFGCNSYSSVITGNARIGGGTVGGCSLQLIARDSDSNSCFVVNANGLADGNTGTNEDAILAGTQAGAWTLGATSGANQLHTVNGTLAVIMSGSGGAGASNAYSGFKILNGTSGTTTQYPYITSKSGGASIGNASPGFTLLAGVPSANDSGTAPIVSFVASKYDTSTGADSNATARSLYGFYKGDSSTLVASCDYAGAWTLGPANTNSSNIINGKLTVQQGSSGNNQTLVVSTGAVVSSLFLEVTSATSGNFVQVYAELHPTADTTLNGAVMQFNVARNTNAAFTTKDTFSWNNFGTTQGSISAAGAWTFPLIHNIGAGNITSGTYTPSIANVANASGITAQVSTYSRVGNIVTVNGVFTFGSTSAGLQTTLTISLPIASNFTLSTDATGVGATDVAGSVNPYLAMQITAKTSSSLVFIYFNAQITSVQTATFTFQYLVK